MVSKFEKSVRSFNGSYFLKIRLIMSKYIFVIIVISLFAAVSCANLQSASNKVNRNFSKTESAGDISQFENVAEVNRQTEAIQNKNSTFFRGILNGIRFQMNLTRDGENLSGTYSYIKIGKDLKLSGKIDKSGKFTLEERDGAGKKTGEWNGIWKKDGNAPGIIIEGDWKKPNGKVELGFYAVQQLIEFTNGAKFTDKVIKENDKKINSDISAVYPEIGNIDSAANFNKIIKKIVDESINSYKKQAAEFAAEDTANSANRLGYTSDLSYDVILANDDFVSLIISNYIYLGGAHGSTVYKTVNYDLKNNRELELANVFAPDSNYLKTISDYIITDLKKQVGDLSDDETIKEGASANAKNFSNWNLSKDGLLITFEPYQVAAYAAGSPAVLVPYDKLKSILRKDGIAAKFAK